MSQLAKVIVLVTAIVMVATFTGRADAAEPLAPGDYTVVISGELQVSFVVDDAGQPHLTIAPADAEVVFAFEDGRVLDEFEIRASGNSYEVEVTVTDRGSYNVEVRQDGVERLPTDLATSDDDGDGDGEVTVDGSDGSERESGTAGRQDATTPAAEHRRDGETPAAEHRRDADAPTADDRPERDSPDADHPREGGDTPGTSDGAGATSDDAGEPGEGGATSPEEPPTSEGKPDGDRSPEPTDDDTSSSGSETQAPADRGGGPDN